MTRSIENQACDACAKAKRRCGKQTPHCLRCRTKGIRCSYPPTKPSQFVLAGEEDIPPARPEYLPGSNLQLSPYSSSSQTIDARLSSGQDLPWLSCRIIDDQIASSWFASTDTWKVRRPESDQSPLSVADIRRNLKKIQLWLAEWVENGSNHFIHATLYQTRLPKCIQDAYTSLTCYLNKNEANEQMVLRIVEERARQLVAEAGISCPDSSEDINSRNSPPLDSFEHIARVHALMVYQAIGLYDGDIRLRHLSERHIPILQTWMQEMVKTASQTPNIGRSVLASSSEKPSADCNPSYITHNEGLLWYSWILAESIRRTWVIGSAIQIIFLFLRGGEATPCQGGMMFTTRKGVWEAPSAVAWEKLCSETHVGLMQMAESDRLFAEVGPEEVNEFTKVILEMTFGRDRMERWGVQVDN